MIRINLLPYEVVEERKRKKKQKNIILIILNIVLLFILISLILFLQKTSLDAKLMQLEKELKNYQKIIENINTHENTKKQLKSKTDMIKNLTKSGLKYPRLMEEILGVLPGGVWLNSLTITEAGTKLQIVFNCSAFDNFEVANFLNNLETSKKFKNNQISAITASGTKLVQFQINSTYEG